MKTRAEKRYYVAGMEVSHKEATAIEKKNQEYMQSGNLADLAKCEFITVVNY